MADGGFSQPWWGREGDDGLGSSTVLYMDEPRTLISVREIILILMLMLMLIRISNTSIHHKAHSEGNPIEAHQRRRPPSVHVRIQDTDDGL